MSLSAAIASSGAMPSWPVCLPARFTAPHSDALRVDLPALAAHPHLDDRIRAITPQSRPLRAVSGIEQARGLDCGFVRLAVLAHHGERAVLQTHRIRHTARLQQEQITINRRGQVSEALY